MQTLAGFPAALHQHRVFQQANGNEETIPSDSDLHNSPPHRSHPVRASRSCSCHPNWMGKFLSKSQQKLQLFAGLWYKATQTITIHHLWNCSQSQKTRRKLDGSWTWQWILWDWDSSYLWFVPGSGAATVTIGRVDYGNIHLAATFGQHPLNTVLCKNGKHFRRWSSAQRVLCKVCHIWCQRLASQKRPPWPWLLMHCCRSTQPAFRLYISCSTAGLSSLEAGDLCLTSTKTEIA